MKLKIYIFLWFLLFNTQAFSSPNRIPQFRGTPYEKVRTLLRKFVAANPQNARLFILGDSDFGIPIEGIEIGQGPVNQLVVGTHHGNEYGSTEVALAFASDLATHPINGQRIFVIPVLNIDGFNAGSREERDKRGNYHDPNRDYPGPCGTEGPFKLKSTQALAVLTETMNIVAAATLHTFSPVVAFPWGMSTQDRVTPYEDFFRTLGQAATSESKYNYGNAADLIYPADGTYEDFAFWKFGTWSMLFELGYSHYPNPASVREMIRVNVPGLRRMFEQAPRIRAEKHNFTGRCDTRLRRLDRHDE